MVVKKKSVLERRKENLLKKLDGKGRSFTDLITLDSRTFQQMLELGLYEIKDINNSAGYFYDESLGKYVPRMYIHKLRYEEKTYEACTTKKISLHKK